MRIDRLPALLLLAAVALTGCPSREEVTDKVGHAPKVFIDKAKTGYQDALEKGEEQREKAEKALDGDSAE